jgi:RNA polymerase sigma-70 factor (ECF subfamily)
MLFLKSRYRMFFMDHPPGEVTLLLARSEKGDREAVNQLVTILHHELRRLAGSKMKSERPDHTLQPSALLNEAYISMVEQTNLQVKSRAHFFGIASTIMRRILIDYARKRSAAKRGGGFTLIPVDLERVPAPEKPEGLLALNEALDRLEQLDPQQARIVELRFFGGLSVEEAGAVLGISDSTVKREWRTAKIWLERELSDPEQ